MFVAENPKGELVEVLTHEAAAQLHDQFVCPVCKQPVGIRNGAAMPAHFYHLGPACEASEPESMPHLLGKLWLKQLGEALGYHVTLEQVYRPIQQRADVVWERPDGPLVLEFQCSPISTASLNKRTRGYHAVGVEVIWIMGPRYASGYPRNKQAKFTHYNATFGWHWWFLNLDSGVLERTELHEGQLAKIMITAEETQVRPVAWPGNNALKEAARLQRALFYRSKRWMDMQQQAMARNHQIGGAPWIIHKRETGLLGLRRSEVQLRLAWLLEFEGETIVPQHELDFWRQERSDKTPIVGQRPLLAVRERWLEVLVDEGYLTLTATGYRWQKVPEWYATIDEKLAHAPKRQ